MSSTHRGVQVLVSGVAQQNRPQISTGLEDLIFETNLAALNSAALPWSDVDAVIMSCSDQVDGRAISSMVTAGPAGCHLKDEINVASSPAHALALGYLSIASAEHDRVLVSSWGKASEGQYAVAEWLTTDPYYDRDVPLTYFSAMAMQAALYRSGDDGPTVDEVHDVVLRNHLNAARNEGAAFSDIVTAEDIARSAIVAWPLTACEIAPESDGCFVVVLERAGGRSVEAGVSSSLVELAGIGWAADAYRLCERDLLGLPHLRSAAAMACSMAGIREPRQLGFFELHDYSADAELLAMAALGLTRDDIERVNLSGGSMGGEAPFGGVLRKICDAFARLSDGTAILEDAGCARSALVQMSSGFAGQFQTVAVLRLVEDQL